MPRKGSRRKKTRTHVVENENVASALSSSNDTKVPKSLVIRRGKVESEIVELVADIRKTLLPYTALNFKEDAKNRKNTLSHYAKELASPLGVTHILALSQNASHINLRMARIPAGPTLTFKVKSFSLTRHVRSVQRRPYDSAAAFHHPPVVVTNNFGDSTASPHVKLLRITFQNLFPAINVSTVKLGDCRRVVLFNLMRREVGGGRKEEGEGEPGKEEEDEEVEVRHYAIKATPVGVNKRVRRLVQTKIPNLNRLEDVADYITGTTSRGEAAPAAVGGNASDSEPEDESAHVVLSSKYAGRGNARSQKSALKLVELGPRLRLKLLKVERGLAGGDVMYHAYVKKSPEEIKAKREEIAKEAALKKRRREEQAENVERKKREAEEKRERKKKRREEREKQVMDELKGREESEKGAERTDEESDTGDGDVSYNEASNPEEE